MEPLTPADCELTDFPFMPLHVARLRDSDLAAYVDPEACWYAVLLWAASWHQIPAASLPDDDRVLAKLCGLGRDIGTFQRVRDGALHGFVKCSDGRLYHPVVAEQANEAWARKRGYRERKDKRVEAAKKAAASRWSSPDSDPNAMRDASETDAAAMRNALPIASGDMRTASDNDVKRMSAASDDDAERIANAMRDASETQCRKGQGQGQGQLIKKEEEAADTASEYAFAGRVIKLTRDHYRSWQASYPDLHLPSILQSRDDWLVENGRTKNWFIPTSNYLARLQGEAVAKARAAIHSEGMPC